MAVARQVLNARDDNPSPKGIAITPGDVGEPGSPLGPLLWFTQGFQGPYGKIFRAFHIGVAGDVNVMHPDGTTAVYKGLPAGAILPVRGLTVMSTSTTATDIVGLI